MNGNNTRRSHTPAFYRISQGNQKRMALVCNHRNRIIVTLFTSLSTLVEIFQKELLTSASSLQNETET